MRSSNIDFLLSILCRFFW